MCSPSQVTFDYKYERFGSRKQRCFCGAAACRGFLGAKPTKGNAASTGEEEEEEEEEAGDQRDEAERASQPLKSENVKWFDPSEHFDYASAALLFPDDAVTATVVALAPKDYKVG